MKLAIATTFDASDVANWSGTPYHMAHAFTQANATVEYIGGLARRLPPGFKIKQFWKKFAAGQRESPRFNTFVAKHYSAEVAKRLAQCPVDAIIAPQINPIAYLDTPKPLVLWTDALYASLIGFYPGFSEHSASSIAEGNIITRECLKRCSLAIFSSDWAARTATEIYGTVKDKVKVVPFGANITHTYELADIQQMIAARDRHKLKLLFLGKHWQRKGGDIVFAVTNALHAAGIPVELNFVGCYPPSGTVIPDYIKCHGFISKRTPEGVATLTRLLQESHFLFVPSRAEAFGIVFCEANAFGLPCLTSYVGGIATVVKDGINGQTFGLDAPVEAYCQYLSQFIGNEHRYSELALSSFNEYQTRLNWSVASKTVLDLIS